MAKQSFSLKRIQIGKSNSTTVMVLSICSFVFIFSAVASRALLSQRSYQGRVITAKKQALLQLKSNNDAASKLASSYKVFVEPSTNIIGGTKTGSSDKDGDNARIVLDALPSKYDFPALATSIVKILSDKNYNIGSVGGSDDELNQAAKAADGPVEIPIQVSVTGTVDVAQGVLDVFERSIRPIQIVTLSLSGANNAFSINVTAKTYYQPEKKISITSTVVK